MSLYEAISEALTIEAPTAGGDTAHPSRPRVAAPPMPPAGLSPRENEVLRLIAAGRSSREIAEEPVLSVRTVERHITPIYEKIGARGRADATAYALKHGIA
jgi:DNA-binding NarL/FixJ family response regulator